MHLFEVGKSVADYYLGLSPKHKDYVCVLPSPQNLNIQEAMELFVEYLMANTTGFNEATVEGFTYIYPNNYTYTLANEIIVTKNEIKYTPCNLLRHLSSRTFTNETLCVDENNEVLELIRNAKNHVKSNWLQPNIKEFKQLLKLQPDVLLSIIEHILDNSKDLSGELNGILREYHSAVPIKQTDKLLGFVNSGIAAFQSKISNYPGLEQYLKVVCGLKISVVLEPSSAEVLAEYSKNEVIENDNDYEYPEKIIPPKKAKPVKGFDPYYKPAKPVYFNEAVENFR